MLFHSIFLFSQRDSRRTGIPRLICILYMHIKAVEKFFAVTREIKRKKEKERGGREIQFGIRRHALSVSMYARKCYRRDRYICLECYDELTLRRSDKYIIFN